MNIHKPEIYFDKSVGLYYFAGEPVCSNCKDEISDETAVYIVRHPLRSQSFGSLWCHHCLNSVKKNCPSVLLASEIFSVQIADQIPANAFVVPLMRMSVSNASEVTTFDVAISNKGVKSDASSTVTIDRTRLAGRESFEGSCIGLDHAKVESKDNLLAVDEVDSFLLGQKESQPCIGSDFEKKRIGGD
jgi:hypothetical protein